MTGDVSLASLLFDHPFEDDRGLLYGVDDEVTAGEARARATVLADELLAAGVAAGQAVAAAVAQWA